MNNISEGIEKLLSFRINEAQVAQFEQYSALIREWNEKINLTTITDPVQIVTKHFLDSASCAVAWGEYPPDSLIDIGTGAGLPGLPLGILYPNMKITLADSVGKKIDFCKLVVKQLKLDNFQFLTKRSEELGLSPKHREKYEWAIARAVANLPVLLEFLLPLVKVGGSVTAQKGRSASAEMESARTACRTLGGQFRPLKQVLIPWLEDERYLIIADKISYTPGGYPRRVGLPAKRPIL
ncbi:MAG TPA: 16S rRNA (guanine(527)-N(7))-methyltransferase RsmG [Bellilinea sp.]|nr:16S rRNA (guanine(527)-N(7))-methyltransferase RsmG [Bellilinea sp.]